MTARSRILLIAAAAVAVVAISAALFLALGPGSAERTRRNVLSSAEYYINRGDFDRALDLVDKLLIADAQDPQAQALRDKAMDGKNHADSAKTSELAQAEASSQKALAQTLDKLGQNLKTPGAGTQSITGGTKTPPDDQAAAAAKARQAEADAQKKAEAEAEAARKKAEADELAKKNGELQAKMRAVNDLVDKGKAAVDSGDLPSGDKLFADAQSKFPEGEDKFAGQKLAEIADSLYSGSKRLKGPDSDAAVKESIQAASDAKKRDATNPLPFYTLGKINSDLNQTDNAITELSKATSLDPKNYLYSYALGIAYLKARRYEDARKAFEATTTLNAKFERGFFNLGTTWKALGEQDKALAAFRQAAAVKPDYGSAWQEIGRIMASRGDVKSAIDAYQKAIKAEPDNTLAMSELAVVYSAGGDNKSAEGLFQRALGVKDDAKTNYNMATVKIKLDKPAEAVKYAEKAVSLSPDVALYQYTLGLACERSSNTDGAISAYAAAAKADAKYADPRVNLGRIYLESGFTDKALDYLVQAYQADPKSFEANNNLGNAYAKKNLFDKSVFHYEIAMNLQPRDPTVRLNLAKSYVGEGNNGAARDAYDQLIKLAPDSWDAYFEYGKLLASMSDNAGAKKVLGDLLAKDPGYAKRAEVEKLMAGL